MTIQFSNLRWLLGSLLPGHTTQVQRLDMDHAIPASAHQYNFVERCFAEFRKRVPVLVLEMFPEKLSYG